MKILSIGNSFSHDAHKYLWDIADAGGFDLKVVGLYIGGCTLEQHADNCKTGLPDYEYVLNGTITERRASIKEVLSEEKWDIVTLQQASGKSGKPQSYFPYLYELEQTVKTLAPQATLWWHQTWAYEQDFDNPNFDAYNRNQQEMFRRIEDASEMAAALLCAKIIPSGTIIQTLRETLPEFDYQKGGASLNRDGFHLSYTYGRYAAAATWYQTLGMGDIAANPFMPEDTDPAIIAKIQKIIKEKCFA